MKISATAEDCERLAPEFLEEEAEYLDSIAWARAYMCNYGRCGEAENLCGLGG